MKLKYYLRGIGIGVIIASIVMGIALGGRNKQLSDSEIRERALELGIVDAEGTTLTEYASGNADVSSDSSIVVEEIDASVAAEADSTIDAADADSTADSVSAESGTGAATEKSTTDDTAAKNSNEAGTKTAVAEETQEDEASETSASIENTTLTTIAAETAANAEVSTVTDTVVATQEQDLTVTENENTGTLYVTVTIPGGIGSDTVCSILKNAGIIDDAAAFNRFLIDKRLDRYIRSGTKKIPEGATYDEIAEIICRK